MRYRGASIQQQIHIFLLCLLLFIFPSAASARDITDFFFFFWPDFCKAGWLNGSGGARSVFQGRMPPGEVSQILRRAPQSVGIAGLWHFCLAMAETNRAKVKPYNSATARSLQDALNDFSYSFGRTPITAPGYSMLTAHYGTALYISGRKEEAIVMWEKGMQARPSSRESYLAMAEMLLKERKNIDALKILLRYEENKAYDSPDVEYFLGHIYFELKRYQKAREHADKAYKLGYPFPGLRRKLERIGK